MDTPNATELYAEYIYSFEWNLIGGYKQKTMKLYYSSDICLTCELKFNEHVWTHPYL